MTNIRNNNYKKLGLNLYNDRYMDFMISKEDAFTSDIEEECIAGDIDFSKKDTFKDNKVFSNIEWNNAKNNGEILEDIGLTGIDNGLITYRKDRISNEEFLKIFTESELDLKPFGKKFFAHEVSGNTLDYVYPIERKDDYVSLKGGFYQGFFKMHGFEYQTLPSFIKDEWNIEFKLRKRNDYETEDNILNSKYPENKGIFFYIGTRAENKFWTLYKRNENTEALKDEEYTDSDYMGEYKDALNNVIRDEYQKPDQNIIDSLECYDCNCDCERNEYFGDTYFNLNEKCDKDKDEEGQKPNRKPCEDDKETTYPNDILNKYDFDEHSRCDELCNSCKEEECKDGCELNGYFGDGYLREEEDGLAFDEDYIKKDIKLDGLKLQDSEGHEHDKKGYFEIETDNKFLIFNRTNTGFTTDTWKEGDTFILTGRTDSPNINYYPYLNRTKTGYTTENIHKLIEENTFSYDIFKDIRNNSLAFKINDDGSITYKLGILDCDKKERYSIIEETTKSGLIKDNEWATINIRLKRTVPADECNIVHKNETMKIMIYVNGYLIFVSKELPLLNLRELDDVPQKQEGVPYNISIGGGTQGLIEGIWLDYYNQPKYTLPLEKNFAGSFIGDIKSFRFYDCPLSFPQILRQNI